MTELVVFFLQAIIVGLISGCLVMATFYFYVAYLQHKHSKRVRARLK